MTMIEPRTVVTPAEIEPVAPMLRIQGLRKQFRQTVAVDRCDLEVMPGEFIALLGPSGCGKTTTLRLIAGFEQPDAGTIELDGQMLVGPSAFVPPERRRIGMVFQEYALFPHMSVGKNVGYGVPRGADRDRRIDDALDLVDLDGYRDRMPHQLSGGQQQRVALARALAIKPTLMLLDEPFSNLDPERRVQIRSDVRDILKRAGITVMLVTHDQEEALSIADRVAVMLNGRIVQFAAPDELYHQPVNRTVASFIGDAQWLHGEAVDGTVTTILGELQVDRSLSGPVQVLIRPEMIEPVPVSGNGLPVGRIVSRTFFGHDQLVTIELSDGSHLHARVSSLARHTPGDRVALAIVAQLQFQAYPITKI